MNSRPILGLILLSATVSTCLGSRTEQGRTPLLPAAYRQGTDHVTQDKVTYLNGHSSQLIQYGNYDRAITELNKSATLDPNTALTYDLLGTCYMGKLRYEEALKNYSKAIAFNTPDKKYFLCNRARCRTQLKDFKVAVTDLNEALALDPKLIVGYRFRAVIRKNQGDFKGALSDMAQVIALDPAPVIDYVDRAKIERAMGDLAGATADEAKATALGWHANEYYADKALAHWHNGDREAAGQDLDQAIAAKPKEPGPYCNDLYLLMQNGDWDKAFTVANQGVAAFPDNPELILQRASVETEEGRQQQAEADIDHVIALNRETWTYVAYGMRGVLRETEGNLKGATDDLNSAIFHLPSDPWFYFWLGNVEEVEGDWNRAITDFHATGDMDHRVAYFSHFNIWVIQARQGKRDEANAKLSAFMDRQPHTDKSVWAETIGHFLLGKIDQKALMAAASDPDSFKQKEMHCESWYYAGVMESLAGNSKAADSDLHQCLASNAYGLGEYVLATHLLNPVADQK